MPFLFLVRELDRNEELLPTQTFVIFTSAWQKVNNGDLRMKYQLFKHYI
jgi:hypothetical protein